MVMHHPLSETDWEKLPAKPPPNPSQWEQVLADLQSGKPQGIPFDTEKQLKGYRIGLARAAATKGMKLEFRADTHILGVRKSSEPYVPKPKPEGGQKRGRRKKTDQDEE